MNQHIAPWSDEEIMLLAELYKSHTLAEISSRLNRTVNSVRGKAHKLGVSQNNLWSETHVEMVRLEYDRAGVDGKVMLSELAERIGKSKGEVCRKAREMGLTNKSRSIREGGPKDSRKFKGDPEALRLHLSSLAKARIKENGHPRGMLGKKHSQETKSQLSRTSKAAHLFVADEERSRRVLMAMKTRIERHGSLAPKVKRGSWDAGWREIGGKRNYYRSRWEANYARYLEWLKAKGLINDWQHEPETFWFEAIKRGVRSYKPDFRVWENDGSSALHEVKGWMDSRSKTTLKRMKKYHPDQKIVLIDGPQYRAIRLKVMRLVPGWEDNQRDSHA
jgi:hypothetical protein